LTTGNLWEYHITAEGATVLQADPLTRLKRTIAGSGSTGSSGALVSTPAASTSATLAFLGGSRVASTVMSNVTWKPIAEHVVMPAQAEAVTWQIRCETWTLSSGISLQIRLRNLTDSTTTVASGTITPGTDPDNPNILELSAVVPAGKLHRLEVLADDTPDNGEEMHAVATIATT
jgi:hypothetical protein